MKQYINKKINENLEYVNLFSNISFVSLLWLIPGTEKTF